MEMLVSVEGRKDRNIGDGGELEVADKLRDN